MEQKNILTSNGGQQVLNENRVDNLLIIFTYSFQEFLFWWYVRMPIWHLRMITRISTFTDDNLSISLLVKNFLVPWHRDYSLIGYVFGFVIKLLYLPIAISAYVLVILLYLFIILVWLLLPPACILFILRSIFSI